MRARFLAAAFIAAGAVAIAAPASAAGVPQTLTHQGRLYDANDKPFDGTIALVFAIYADENASAALWTETDTVTFDDGYFSVSIGETTPFTEGLFDGSARYLGIKVGADPEMTPRVKVQSVPYAMVAGDAIGDVHPTSVSIAGVGTVIDGAGKWVGDPTGLQGPTGPMGPAGAAGPTGAQGPTGPTGAQGPMGPAGPTGAQGTQGPMGPAGPTGAEGPTGPAGATGPTGVVATVFTTGFGADPTTALAFLSPTVIVTVAAGGKILTWSTKALGSSSAGGADKLTLFMCYQSTVSGSTIITVGSGVLGLRVPQNTRLNFGLNATFTGLAAGSYKVGLCGYTDTTNQPLWNLNEYGYTSAIVMN
jgi:hypothetical protein